MNVNEAISKAQKLMTDQTFWDKVNAVDNRQGKKTVGYEPNMFEHKQPNIQMQQPMKKTGNPVLDSFIDKPPMTGDGCQYQLNETYTQPQQYTQTQNYQQQTNVGNGIDYNYIKYMIEEGIKNALSKQPINENATNNLIGLKMAEGNKIQFMDSKGNIYEGVLKLKKKRQ
jgi:hypothetical protein